MTTEPRAATARTAAGAAALLVVATSFVMPVAANADRAGSVSVRSAAAAPTPPLRSSRVFGHSVRGRPLVVHVLGDPHAAHRVLVVGCIHGSERAGIPVVRRLERMAPQDGVAYYLVEDLNPDGAARHTRQNARGVDLNRNFPKRWSSASSKGSLFWSGPRPLSEPESRAAYRLIRQVKPTLTVWYHQHLNLVDLNTGSRAVAKAYARATRMRLTTLQHLAGSVATWQRARAPHHTVLVVELPAHVTSAQRARNAAAVRLAAVG